MEDTLIQMSSIVYIGLNHRTASIDLRERLALSRQEISELLATLCKMSSPLAEAVLLSTCNRVEIYGLTQESDEVGDASRAICHIEECLADAQDIPLATLRRHLVHGQGQQAVEHLCRVAAGLDSMILGEAQILGQVVDAHETAIDCGTAGPVLAALLRKAIECGKRARTETDIGGSAASVSYAAVELAKNALGSLKGRNVLLIGAGEMAQLAAHNLCASGADRFLVVNRTFERAERLAQPLGGQAYAWEAMESALRQADIVLCSAGAPHTIIRRDMVERVCRDRNEAPLFFIDIGVPRNVDPRVGELAGVSLYDIDDLQQVVQRNLSEREREVPKVQAIVQEATDEFMAWLAGREVISTICDLRQMAEQICADQVQRALNRLGPLSEREQEVVRSLGQRITHKLLHQPTVRLKESARNGDGAEYVDAVRALFGLEPTPDKAGARQ
jgi:glutamyl-tRNA reductase